jgi:hypothetical protein
MQREGPDRAINSSRRPPSRSGKRPTTFKLTALVDIKQRDGPTHAFDFIAPVDIMQRDWPADAIEPLRWFTSCGEVCVTTQSQ